MIERQRCITAQITTVRSVVRKRIFPRVCSSRHSGPNHRNSACRSFNRGQHATLFLSLSKREEAVADRTDRNLSGYRIKCINLQFIAVICKAERIGGNEATSENPRIMHSLVDRCLCLVSMFICLY